VDQFFAAADTSLVKQARTTAATALRVATHGTHKAARALFWPPPPPSPLTPASLERGLLRPPRRWKRAEFKIGDQAVRTVVATKAGEPR
jgi:hypothetical protein